MGKVFVGVSIDGYIAGANRGPTNPLGDLGLEAELARASEATRTPGHAWKQVTCRDL